jgi:hypothetical protein
MAGFGVGSGTIPNLVMGRRTLSRPGVCPLCLSTSIILSYSQPSLNLLRIGQTLVILTVAILVPPHHVR